MFYEKKVNLVLEGEQDNDSEEKGNNSITVLQVT